MKSNCFTEGNFRLCRPICRTVADAVHVLDAIVGFDYNDAQATRVASKYIPYGGFAQFLKANGLKGKRLGIVRNPFLAFSDKLVGQTFEQHLQTLKYTIYPYMFLCIGDVII